MSHIPPRQLTAIQALLVSPTIRDAASRAAVAERTLYRWLRHDHEFIEEYRRCRRLAFERAVSKLASLSDEAVEQLREILTDKAISTRDRLVAIRTVLEHARLTEEADVAGLVGQLEALLEQQAGGTA